jgi:hypothetical protein
MASGTSLNARAEASRRNGARSRGPASADERWCSARNALKHGLRASNIRLLGNEDNDPTWTAQGLSFTGDDYVPLGSLPEIAAFDIVFKPTSPITPASPPMALTSTVTGTHGIILGASEKLPSGRSVLIKPDDGQGVGVADTISAAWHLLQLDFRASDPHRWLFRLDGTRLTTTVFGTPGKVVSDTTILGRGGSGAFWGYNGALAYLLTYGEERSDQQITQNAAALSTRLASRGVMWR